MSTFSGTNLPSIIRLGGSGDTVQRFLEGTASAGIPAEVPSGVSLPVQEISLPLVKPPQARHENVDPKASGKGKARRIRRK